MKENKLIISSLQPQWAIGAETIHARTAMENGIYPPQRTGEVKVSLAFTTNEQGEPVIVIDGADMPKDQNGNTRRIVPWEDNNGAVMLLNADKSWLLVRSSEWKPISAKEKTIEVFNAAEIDNQELRVA